MLIHLYKVKLMDYKKSCLLKFLEYPQASRFSPYPTSQNTAEFSFLLLWLIASLTMDAW